MTKKSGDDRLSKAHEEFTRLYYLYAQFYTTREGYFPYRGCLENEYLAVSQMLHDQFDPETLEFIVDDEALHAIAGKLVELEMVSRDKAEELLKGITLDELLATLPSSQPLTAEDVAKINAYETELVVEPRVFQGITENYWETGTEGVYWAVYEDGKEGYDGLNLIEEGDHLTLYNVDESVAFSGIILKDHKTGWKPYHHDKPFGLGQQSCLYYLVHWLQKGMTEYQWAELFLRPDKLRAKLVKPKKVERT